MEKTINSTDLDKTKAVINKILTKTEAKKISPLMLAWIGDGIFSDYVRKFLLLNNKGKISKLHKLSTEYVRAQAQSEIIHYLKPLLTDEEKEIVKKGRNTISQVPKNTKVQDYRYSTGFESLIGWLKLTGQEERITELNSIGINYIKTNQIKNN